MPVGGRVLFFTLLLMHLALSIAALLWSFGHSSAAFDGRPVAAGSAAAASILLAASWFPINLLPLSPITFPGMLGWIPVLGNSLIWASLLTWAILWRRTRSRRDKQFRDPGRPK